VSRNPYLPPNASIRDSSPEAQLSVQPLNRMRLFAGFAVATLVATAGFMLVVWFGSGKSLSLRSALAAFTFNLLFVAFVTGILVFPLYLLLRRSNLVSIWSAGITGFLIPALGLVAFALIARIIPRIGAISLPLNRLLMLCFAGAAAGIAFWFVADGSARPNKSPEPDG
jgi:hypothetical protein